jgi:capsular exopolysaccharide synthesis family protein
MKQVLNKDEMNLEKLFGTIAKYKWLILFITLFTTLSMVVYLYFTPSVYVSTTILEKTKEDKKSSSGDVLMSAFSMGTSSKVDKEIELLKTFFINNEALKKVDFSTRIFVRENYREKEVYLDKPVDIDNIEIYNDKILNKKLTIYPQSEGFFLKRESTFFDKIKKFFSSSVSLDLDETKLYFYGQDIKNKYFKLTIHKKQIFSNPVSFIICGENRNVYDKIIEKNLHISQLTPSTPLIKISYDDNIPERADRYINALTKSFIEQSILVKNEQNNKILAFIDEQLDTIRFKLKRSENNLEKYRVSNKIIKPSIQANSYIRKISDIEINLSENLLQERLINNLIKFTKNNRNLASIAPSLSGLEDSVTLQLVKTLQTLQMKEDEYKLEYTDQFPKLRSVRKRIYYVRQKILSNIKSLKKNISQKRQTLAESKRIYEKKLESLPTKEKTMINIKRDYDVSSSMYNYLLKKRTENQLVVVSTLSDYRIIDFAHSNENAIKPKRLLLTVAALMVGLLLGIIIAVFLEGLNKKIESKEELEELSHFPLYAVIPKVKGKEVGLEVFNHLNSPFTESFRSLRTNIQAKEKSGTANVVLVSSLIGGEGKTTIVSNLASIFQMAGYKSIILSLDLRKPSLHKAFKISNARGMSGYLQGENSINDIIFKTEHENLHVIPSGPIPNYPAELILSERLKTLIEILKSKYDYIFIDTAPIGLVSDTIHLMKYADLKLIVLREKKAERDFIQNLEKILEKNDIKNIGLILNASLSRKSSTAYGYGYGYGYEE